MKKYIPYLIAALVGFHLRWIIRTERLELLHERRGHHRSSAVRSDGVVVQRAVPTEEKEKPLLNGNSGSGKENVLQWYFTTFERKSQVKWN